MNRTRILGRNPISGLNLLFLAVMLLALPMASRAQDTPIAQQVAKTFGIDSFGQIETMRYTWNAEFPMVAKSPTNGNGARRPTRFPTRGKTRKAIRSRLPISAQSSTVKAISLRKKSIRHSPTISIG